MKQVHFQLLLGKRVRDVNDKVVGRVQSARAVRRETFYVIEDFEVGTAALLRVLGLSLARIVGFGSSGPRFGVPLRIPWRQLDLSDPERPRLTCTKEELLALQKNG